MFDEIFTLVIGNSIGENYQYMTPFLIFQMKIFLLS